MTKSKKPIPNIADILEMFDIKSEEEYAVRSPEEGKEKAEEDLREQEELTASVFRDFSTITIGDYINAAHAFNREMMGSKLDADQEMAYFTLFAFEERAKRMSEHYTYIN